MASMDEENGDSTAMGDNVVFERADHLARTEIVDVKADAEVRCCEVAPVRGEAARDTRSRAINNKYAGQAQWNTYVEPLVAMTRTSFHCSVS